MTKLSDAAQTGTPAARSVVLFVMLLLFRCYLSFLPIVLVASASFASATRSSASRAVGGRSTFRSSVMDTRPRDSVRAASPTYTCPITPRFARSQCSRPRRRPLRRIASRRTEPNSEQVCKRARVRARWRRSLPLSPSKWRKRSCHGELCLDGVGEAPVQAPPRHGGRAEDAAEHVHHVVAGSDLRSRNLEKARRMR